MKKSIFLIALVLFACFVSAQSYRPIISSGTRYFQHSGRIYTLAVSDTRGGHYTFTPTLFPNLDSISLACVGTGLFGLVGKKMINEGDTAFLFYNMANKAIYLLTNTHKGANWLGYDDPNVSVTFHHLSDSLVIINGETDSIKILEPQVQVKVLHEVSGDDYGHFRPIWLSKHHGLLRFPNFYNFPYLNTLMYGYDLPLPDYFIPAPDGTHNITWDSIYDYEPGEEFHVLNYSYSEPLLTGGPRTWDTTRTIFEVLRKERSGKDSLKYTGVQYTWYRSFNGKEATSSATIDTPTILLTRRSFLDLQPGVTYPNYVPATHTMPITPLNFIKTNYPIHSASGTDSCISHLFDWYARQEDYLNGCGGPYYKESDWGITIWAKAHQLVFAKKKHRQFGVPFPKHTGVHTTATLGDWHIAPNPTSDLLHVQTSTDVLCKVTILDVFGREYIQAFITRTGQLDVSSLQAGLYYIQLATKDGKLGQRSFIKK